MRSKILSLINPLRNEGLAVILAASLALNVLLAWQLKRSRPAVLQMHGLAVGEAVPEFRAREVIPGASDVIEQIRYSDAPKGTLIYYFSPNCRWCQKNAANFAALAARVGREYRVVSYTPDVDGLPKYLLAAHHEAPVFTDDGADIRKTLKLTGTPETLLVSKSGRVVRNWEGAYIPGTQQEIESYFGVRLPGLASWQSTTDFERAGF
ncbi:MAG: hypothetical protein JO340_05715 [Acidobacteriaceae bacterium]|nr:hypothetical protein [Acidobacteriaceae bacterium]